MDFHLDLNTETVGQVAVGDPICLPASSPVREAFERMKEHRTGSVLICRDGVLSGIFTERDALKLMASGADLDTPIEQHMVSNPVTLSDTDTVGKAIAKMSYGGYRRLPIVDSQGYPQGLVRTSGILNYLVAHFPGVVYNLPPKPHHTTQQREGA